MNTAQVRPISTSQKYSNELNFSANSGQRWRGQNEYRGAEQAADCGEHEPRAQRNLRLAFFAIAYASSV
jgi:hypothetical protein